MTSTSLEPHATAQPAFAFPAAPRALRAFEPSDPETELDWRRVVAALLRFKWPILAVTCLGTAAGLLATRYVKPQYAAQVTVWIDESGQRGGPDRGPIRPGHLLEPGAWLDLIRSYAVLDQVVRDERLYLSSRSSAALDADALVGLQVGEQLRPGSYRLQVDGAGQNWALRTAQGVELERGAVGDSIGRSEGLRWAPRGLPPGRTVDFGITTLRDAALGLADHLDLNMDPAGNFLRVELRGTNPRAVTTTVNDIGGRFVQVASDLKREQLSELTKILNQQVGYAHDNLKAAEAALESFRVRTITLPSDRPRGGTAGAGTGPDPVLTPFFDTQLEREQIASDRAALAQVLAHPDSGLSADALGVIGSVQRSSDLAQALKELTAKEADLRALRYRYSDEAPPVKKLLGNIATLEHETIPTLVRTLSGDLAAREAELGQHLERDRQTLRAIPARSIEQARLERSVTLAENVYTTLEQRFEEAHLAEASTVPDVRILDSATVPQHPTKNTAPRLIMLALFASFGAALVGAVLIDRFDPRVRYPQQVSRDMGLTILGALPHVRANGKHPGRSRAENDAEVLEALRAISFNLGHAYGTAGPLIVTITSPGPGDGKSFLSANLARTYADAGQRTLLVDADIRRGVLHRRLAARRRPGLSDLLQGGSPYASAVQQTAYGFGLIGCGTRSATAPELLSSPAMGQLITGVRAAYDVILIDSPPLAAGVDPFILGTLTGNLLVVLRTGYSNRDFATAKLEMLARLPVRLLGAVLNDVSAELGSRYAYSYFSYYLPGYEAVDEAPAARVALR